MSVFSKSAFACGTASLIFCGLGAPALAQTPAPAGNGTTALPDIVVQEPGQVAGKPKQRPKPHLAPCFTQLAAMCVAIERSLAMLKIRPVLPSSKPMR